MDNLKDLAQKAQACAIYKNVIDNPAIQILLNLMTDRNNPDFIKNYAAFYNYFTGKINSDNFYNFIETLILEDDNIFTRAAAATKNLVSFQDKSNGIDLSSNILNAAKYELSIFGSIAALTKEDITDIPYLPNFCNKPNKSSRIDNINIENAAFFHNKYGFGILTRSFAFTWNSSESALIPVLNTDPVTLYKLKEYMEEKQQITDNTLNFINGLPAQNILLYGDRGTGKSSTVHAVLNEYKNQGLRLIELNKNSIKDIKKISAIISGLNNKFIIFIDDLSFSSANDEYAELKAILEGSIEIHPNILIYATTNRRHIIKESFSDRIGEELHKNDTIEEQLSLSDRFGIVITFINPSKSEFITILKAILTDRGININETELIRRAEQFALNKGGRSPRIAKQLADIVEAELKK